MNAITIATRDVFMSIPEPILRYGLIKPKTDDYMLSLDHLLLTKVIRPLVMVDMDAYGSNKIAIPVNECSIVYRGTDGTTLNVPKKLTNFRSIAIPVDLTIGRPLQLFGVGRSNSDRVSESIGPVQGYVNSNVTLVGENTVFIQKYEDNGIDAYLNCIIENDAMLNNISSRNYMALGELVILATKAYIYNEVVLKLNEGYILQGQSSDGFKDIINEWSSSLQDYKEYFQTKWRKISFMNDKPRRSTLIKSMFGSNT